jgi:hypothetical protein
LRQAGETWGDPKTVKRPGVDCEARSGDDVLLVQVTRVPFEESLWSKLATVGTAHGGPIAGQAAAQMMRAITEKKNRLVVRR